MPHQCGGMHCATILVNTKTHSRTNASPGFRELLIGMAYSDTTHAISNSGTTHGCSAIPHRPSQISGQLLHSFPQSNDIPFEHRSAQPSQSIGSLTDMPHRASPLRSAMSASLLRCSVAGRPTCFMDGRPSLRYDSMRQHSGTGKTSLMRLLHWSVCRAADCINIKNKSEQIRMCNYGHVHPQVIGTIVLSSDFLFNEDARGDGPVDTGKRTFRVCTSDSVHGYRCIAAVRIVVLRFARNCRKSTSIKSKNRAGPVDIVILPSLHI